jgi:hypothetical protein
VKAAPVLKLSMYWMRILLKSTTENIITTVAAEVLLPVGAGIGMNVVSNLAEDGLQLAESIFKKISQTDVDAMKAIMSFETNSHEELLKSDIRKYIQT